MLTALALSACSLEHLDPVLTGLSGLSGDDDPGVTSLLGSGSGSSSSGFESTSSGFESTSSGFESTSSGSESTSSGSASTTSGSASTSSGSESTTSGSESTTSGSESTTSVGDETSTGAPLAECVPWMRAIETPDPTHDLHGLAVDGAGNVVIVGEFRGDAVDFGVGPMNSAQGQLYVAKYGPDGAGLWSRQFGPGGDGLAVRGKDIVFDVAGNVVAVGDYWESIDLGGGSLPDPPNGPGGFIVELGPDGDHVWSEGFVAPAHPVRAESVAAGATGDVVLLMTSLEPVDLGAGPVGVKGNNTLVARLADDGALVWGRALTGEGTQGSITGPRAAFDPGGAVLITGRQDRAIDFGGVVVDVGAKSPVLVARLNPAGAFEWVKHSTGAGGPSMVDVAVDGSGWIHLGGYIHGLFAFGGPLLVPTSGQNAVAVVLDGAGGHLWSERYGSGVDAYQGVHVLAVNPAGERLLAGQFHGTIDLGGAPLTNLKAHPDVFVAQQGPLGEHRWSRSFAGEGTVFARGAAIDPAGSAWIGGIFAGELVVGDQVFNSPAAHYRIYVTRMCADDLP